MTTPMKRYTHRKKKACLIMVLDPSWGFGSWVGFDFRSFMTTKAGAVLDRCRLFLRPIGRDSDDGCGSSRKIPFWKENSWFCSIACSWEGRRGSRKGSFSISETGTLSLLSGRCGYENWRGRPWRKDPLWWDFESEVWPRRRWWYAASVQWADWYRLLASHSSSS